MRAGAASAAAGSDQAPSREFCHRTRAPASWPDCPITALSAEEQSDCSRGGDVRKLPALRLSFERDASSTSKLSLCGSVRLLRSDRSPRRRAHRGRSREAPATLSRRDPAHASISAHGSGGGVPAAGGRERDRHRGDIAPRRTSRSGPSIAGAAGSAACLQAASERLGRFERENAALRDEVLAPSQRLESGLGSTPPHPACNRSKARWPYHGARDKSRRRSLDRSLRVRPCRELIAFGEGEREQARPFGRTGRSIGAGTAPAPAQRGVGDLPA